MPLGDFTTPGQRICPCQNPAVIRTWESDLYLCDLHAREWLRSPEKERAKRAIEEDNEEELKNAVLTFISRIAKRRGPLDRIRDAFAALFS